MQDGYYSAYTYREYKMYLKASSRVCVCSISLGSSPAREMGAVIPKFRVGVGVEAAVGVASVVTRYFAGWTHSGRTTTRLTKWTTSPLNCLWEVGTLQAGRTLAEPPPDSLAVLAQLVDRTLAPPPVVHAHHQLISDNLASLADHIRWRVILDDGNP